MRKLSFIEIYSETQTLKLKMYMNRWNTDFKKEK